MGVVIPFASSGRLGRLRTPSPERARDTWPPARRPRAAAAPSAAFCSMDRAFS